MIAGDATRLPLRDSSVHCVVTSPPYLGERIYGDDEAEIGRCGSVREYLHETVAWCAEIRRVLRPDGVLWLNVGDNELIEKGDVWTFRCGHDSDAAHLAPFPDELAARCLLPTTQPGDVVLDPFAGSGTVERVATRYGRRAVSVDLYAGRMWTRPRGRIGEVATA